jgi:hypothetical protein
MRFLQFLAIFLTGAAVAHLLPRSHAFQDAKP